MSFDTRPITVDASDDWLFLHRLEDVQDHGRSRPWHMEPPPTDDRFWLDSSIQRDCSLAHGKVVDSDPRPPPA